MKRANKLGWALCVSVMVFFACLPVQLQAGFSESGDSSAPVADTNSAGFSAKAILPENQEGPYSYFNLRMQPGQTQTLSVELSSFSTQDHIIYIQVLNGETNTNGEIDYGTRQLDASLVHPFSALAHMENTEILLPAGKNVVVDIVVDMPQQELVGKILGGLCFVRHNNAPASGQGAQLTNDFAYIIGVVLFENDTPPASEFSFAQITPSVVNYRPVFVCSLQNTQAVIEKEMQFGVELFLDGELYITIQNKNISFAPNSQMDYPIPIEEADFLPGQYRAVIYLENATGEQWNFESNFTVEGEQVQILHEQAIPPGNTRQAPVWAYIAGAVVLLLVLGATTLLMVKKRKKILHHTGKNIYKRHS